MSQTLNQISNYIISGGRIVVISYHSLEDRIVKNYLNKSACSCICSIDAPICQCNHEPSIKIITKKPIIPNNKEIINNLKSRSAKMRVGEKI